MIEKLEYLVPVLRVTDTEEPIRFFETLGFECRWRLGDPVWYAGLYLGSHVIHVGRAEEPPNGRIELYLQVPDVDRIYASVQAAGLNVVETLDDRPYGMRDFAVVGPEAIRIAFGSELEHE